MLLLRVLNVALLAISGVGALAFIGCYGAGKRWFLSSVGRGIMAFTASVAFLAIYAVLVYFIGKPVWIQIVRVIGLAAIASATWNQVRVVIQIRYGERQKDHD